MGLTFFARRVAMAMLALTLTAVTGCQPYLLHVALGQGDLLTRAVPIERVIADPGTSAETAGKLALVRDAAAYAAYWGLDVGRSYRTYAALDREATVWTVVRAEATGAAADPALLADCGLCPTRASLTRRGRGFCGLGAGAGRGCQPGTGRRLRDARRSPIRCLAGTRQKPDGAGRAGVPRKCAQHGLPAW